MTLDLQAADRRRAMRPRADLALLATAELVTQFGAMLTVLAIALHLQPSGPGWVAAAMVAELAPMALLALVAGAVVDRLPNRPVMVAAYVTQAVAVAMMSIVMDAEWLVLVLLAVVGGAASAARPAALSLVPHVVDEKNSTRAYSRIATAGTLGFLGGLAGSGLLTGTVGVTGVLRLDAATYAVQAALILCVRARRTPAMEVGEDPAVGRISGGLRAIWNDRLLRPAIGGLVGGLLASTTVNVASVFLVVDTLGSGPTAYGLVEAAWALGAIAGSWVMGRGSAADQTARAISWAGILLGGALLAAGTVVALAVTAFAWTVAGFANGVQGVAAQAVLRLRVDDKVRGRAFAAMGALCQSAAIAAMLLGAIVVNSLGPPTTLVMSGSFVVVTSGLAFVFTARAGGPNAIGWRRCNVGRRTDQHRATTTTRS